jgi:hypothetical protein
MDTRAELEAIAAEAATLTDRRDAAVQRARDEKMPWNEICGILGMTPQGLRKALKRRQEQQ